MTDMAAQRAKYNEWEREMADGEDCDHDPNAGRITSHPYSPALGFLGCRDCGHRLYEHQQRGAGDSRDEAGTAGYSPSAD